jgi:dCTP deaminase
MIIPAQEIRKLCFKRDMINPFFERTRSVGMTYGLSPAGYDIRLDERVELTQSRPFVLASSVEHFNIPNDVLAQVCDKSSLARQGLCVLNTVIEPGWRGFLTLELLYHGHGRFSLSAGAPIAQIIFMRLESRTQQPYEGKYQDQERGAVPAREDA